MKFNFGDRVRVRKDSNNYRDYHYIYRDGMEEDRIFIVTGEKIPYDENDKNIVNATYDINPTKRELLNGFKLELKPFNKDDVHYNFKEDDIELV